MNGFTYGGMIEAVLFACGEPVSVSRLAEATGLEPEEASNQADILAAKYAREDRGIRIVKLGDSYQMCTSELYAEPVKRALEIRRNTVLSQAALEVLAVVAYNQPVTKAFVEQIRGVDCSGVMSTLAEKGLIEEAGRLELPGRPISYVTTENFLRVFSMQSLDQLPAIESAEEEFEESENQMNLL